MLRMVEAATLIQASCSLVVRIRAYDASRTYVGICDHDAAGRFVGCVRRGRNDCARYRRRQRLTGERPARRCTCRRQLPRRHALHAGCRRNRDVGRVQVLQLGQTHVVAMLSGPSPGRRRAEVAVDVILGEPSVGQRALGGFGVDLRIDLSGALRVGCLVPP